MCFLPSGRGESQDFLPSGSLSNLCFLTIRLNPLFLIHLNKHGIQVIRGLPLPLLPSLCPVSVKFAKPCFRITCTRYFNCLLNLNKSVFFILLITSSQCTYSVHGCLRQKKSGPISSVSIFPHHSQPYKRFQRSLASLVLQLVSVYDLFDTHCAITTML